MAARTRLAVHGACGRMGRAILAAVRESDDLEAVAAIDRVAGASIEGIAVSGSVAAIADADVVIDFSHPGATATLAAECAARGKRLVVGTTGLDAAALTALDALAARVAVVVAPNTSVGVTVLFHLAREAARLLGEDFDAEIVEVHHKKKVDAPSGTALRLAEAVAEGKGVGKESFVHGRSGMVGARPTKEIGIHAVRAGDVVGEHTLTLAGPAERVELVHRAHDRALFARGALRAARWVSSSSVAAGRYDMRDVLGLR